MFKWTNIQNPNNNHIDQDYITHIDDQKKNPEAALQRLGRFAPKNKWLL